MWQWWTLQYGCYCHTLICRVSNCCLCLYLQVAGRTMTGSWKIVLGSWNLFWARQWELCVHVYVCGVLLWQCRDYRSWCRLLRTRRSLHGGVTPWSNHSILISMVRSTHDCFLCSFPRYTAETWIMYYDVEAIEPEDRLTVTCEELPDGFEKVK